MATFPETHLDLLETSLATLATVGPDGRPQLSTVWFLSQDDQVRLSLNTARQKTKNLTVNPAVSLHIQDHTNPGRYLEVRGDATIETDDDYVFADEVGAKYGTELRLMDGPNETRVAVSIIPTRVNAIDLAAG